jgi:aspartate aminotransferase
MVPVASHQGNPCSVARRICSGDARATCFAGLRKELLDRTITIRGASKSYAMTGWRMGWALGPLHVIKAMGNVQSQQKSCPSSISQYATIAALDGNQKCVAEIRQKFATRRDLVCKRFKAMPGIGLLPPDGAFFAFLDGFRNPLAAISRAVKTPILCNFLATAWVPVRV